MEGLLLKTPCGDVQGVPGKHGCRAFKGIRYATAGRWQYPVPVTHWDGVYSAEHFGACSYQPRAFYNEEDVPEKAFYYNEFRKGEHYDYSEDCLFLNVWAPPAAQNAPVLFYIHGGGFVGGCGHEKHFDGAALCKQGVVVVTVNYRLGPLGFCCLPELAAEAGHTGNYALYDQLCALQWVHDNIAAFGGDAANITIMGQSAGAMSVQQLVVSPLTKGLVARAVMLSGGGVMKPFDMAKQAADGYAFWQALSERAGAKTLAEFRSVEPAKLFAAFSSLLSEQKNAMMFCSPVVDGQLLPESAAQAAKAGRQLAVPYLMCSTSEDMMPPFIHKMAKGWARMQADQGKCPSYTCFFCRQLPGDDAGAWHSSDLWYWFGSLENGWRPFTDWDRALSDSMVRYLANFARAGDPNGQDLPQWLPTEKGQNQVLRLGDADIRMGGVSIAKLTRTMMTKPNVGE